LKNRIKKIFRLTEKKIDTIIIKNSVFPYIDKNFFYTTGLENGIFEEATAILYTDGKIDLIISELEAETAKKADADITIYKSIEERNNILKEMLSPIKNIGINSRHISYMDYQKLKKLCPNSKFIDISDSFVKARLVKDTLEIQAIKKSCKIADQVMEKIPNMLCDGIHEYEVAAEIDYLLQKNGADKPAFDTISSFGKNTAEPHYSHGNTKLKKGDLVLLDFGACFKRYNSDITRTFVFGKIDKKQKEMHETVLTAQKIGFETIKPGIKAGEIHRVVSSYINNTKFKGCFTHSTGHSLGLEVHDGPGFSPESNIELKENMVLTVEPGVYIPGFGGIRIEDDILIVKNGIELLTNTTRELLEVM